MNKFDVLGTMRAIRDDKSLSTAQLAILMCAVLRTDNTSCHVRYAVYLLAEDAKMTEKTAGKAINSPEVQKYFSKVERNRRRVDFWFHPSPRQYSLPSQTVVTTLSDGSEYRPSTSCLPLSTRTGDSATASPPNQKTDQGLEKGMNNEPSPNLKENPEPEKPLEVLRTTNDPETVTTTVSDTRTKQEKACAYNAELRRKQEEKAVRIEEEW